MAAGGGWVGGGAPARQKSRRTLLLADVDQFRAFTEAYGAESADDCLRRVAVEFSGGLHRGGDLGARFGGDEFAALLPATDAAGAGGGGPGSAPRGAGPRHPPPGSALPVG